MNVCPKVNWPTSSPKRKSKKQDLARIVMVLKEVSDFRKLACCQWATKKVHMQLVVHTGLHVGSVGSRIQMEGPACRCADHYAIWAADLRVQVTPVGNAQEGAWPLAISLPYRHQALSGICMAYVRSALREPAMPVLPIPYIRRNQRTTPADDSSARAGRALWYHNGNHLTTGCAATRDKQEPMYSLLVITT